MILQCISVAYAVLDTVLCSGQRFQINMHLSAALTAALAEKKKQLSELQLPCQRRDCSKPQFSSVGNSLASDFYFFTETPLFYINLPVE